MVLGRYNSVLFAGFDPPPCAGLDGKLIGYFTELSNAAALLKLNM
jgi:hypothetical protein